MIKLYLCFFTFDLNNGITYIWHACQLLLIATKLRCDVWLVRGILAYRFPLPNIILEGGMSLLVNVLEKSSMESRFILISYKLYHCLSIINYFIQARVQHKISSTFFISFIFWVFSSIFFMLVTFNCGHPSLEIIFMINTYTRQV